MAEEAGPTAGEDRPQRFEFLLLGLIAASIAAQAWLIHVQEFNWDEFRYLGQVHDYLRGDLTGALQTIHVHLFGWLTKLPGNEIDQLIAGRWIMLICECVTLFAIYKLCRTWTDRAPALFAVCAFALMPSTLQHGASFRVDPLGLALAMTALASIGRCRPTTTCAGATALLTALSAMVTIKVAFFAPAFAGVAFWRLVDPSVRKTNLRWVATIGVLTLIFFPLLYWAHQASLPASSVAGSGEMAKEAASKVFSDTSLFLRRRVLAEAMFQAPAQWGLIFVAFTMLFWLAIRGSERAKALVLLCCATPLLSLALYRNAYPYFIPFVAAPATPVIAWLIRSRGWPRRFQLILLLIMGVTMLAALPWILDRDQKAQRSVIDAVHQIFPAPVRVIDHGHLIGSFPDSGFFMSNWGMEGYRAGPPRFSDMLSKESIPLLIVSGKPLEHAMGLIRWDISFFPLKPEDQRVLRENFIPHWGPIWVAGKRLTVPAEERPFEIAIPGAYTIEGSEARIDGRSVSAGGVIELDRGVHRITGASLGTVTLRWGNHLRRPITAPPTQAFYKGFSEREGIFGLR